jgi:hypothetical protein
LDEHFEPLKEWIESYGLVIDKIETTEEERVRYIIPINANKTYFIFVALTRIIVNSGIKSHKKDRPPEKNHIKGVSLKSMQKYDMAKDLVKEKLNLPDIPSAEIGKK